MKIKETLGALQRIYPQIGPHRFMHRKASDLRRKGKQIMIHFIAVSASGRASVHRTSFSQGDRKSVQQWGEWLASTGSGVLRGEVLSFINTKTNDLWAVRRVIGWHFHDGIPTYRDRNDPSVVENTAMGSARHRP